MQRNGTYEVLATPPPPPRNSEVELLEGEKAFALLSAPGFQSAWDALYTSCPWATVFQSRAFVSTWYQVYRKEYLPILVRSEQEGQLTGLLTMALPLENLKGSDSKNVKGRIVGAGQYEAEYQTWLSDETKGESFIKEALTQIRKAFPRCDIHLRYLPPQVPLAWVESDLQWQQHVVLHACRRPLMDMHAPELAKMFRKSEYRNKLNRLKKLGELNFEHVTDPSRFSAILPELIVQYDFRQGAMFNKNQFRDNPLKAEFLLAMFRQNLLHVSVLKVNEEIIASIAAVAGKNWVHLGGLNMHTPFSANYYSPGFVHFIMLGQKLAQEGVAVFDLTPGGDSYKERMANSHDQVYELIIASNTSGRIKKQLRKQLDRRLIKAGVRPMGMELLVKKKIYLLKGKAKALKHPDFVNATLGRIKSLFVTGIPNIYKIEPEPGASIQVKLNNLEDLLNFDAHGYRKTRWEFLEEAMRRFECGDRSYTWSANGQLLACAWLSCPKPAAAGEAVTKTGDRAELQGFYCHPAKLDELRAFLGAVAVEVAKQEGTGQVYAVFSAGDVALYRAWKRTGNRLPTAQVAL